MQLISYEIFSCQEDFIDWQQSNEKTKSFKICTIQPWTQGFDINPTDKYDNNFKGSVKVGIFVTYLFEE